MALSQRTDRLAPRDEPDPRRRQLAGPRDARRRARRAGLRAPRRRRLDRGRRRQAATSTGCSRGARSSSATPILRRSRRCDAAADRGTTFGAPTEAEVELAAEIVDAVPSIEMVRLVSSGTEASMSALRLARAATRRDRVIKFAGCYHGHVDALLASAGSGRDDARHPVDARACRPGSPADTIVCGFNDVDGVAAACARYGEGLAAILVEPVAGNMGVRPARAGIPRGAAHARRCDRRAARVRRGDDRVPRGTRRGAGAVRRAARPHDPREDRRRRPSGGRVRRPRRADGAPGAESATSTRQARSPGTRSRPPRACPCSAGCASPAVYDELERTSARLEDGLAPFGIVQRVGAMLTLFCRDGAGRELRGRRGVRHRAVRRAVPPSARGAASTSPPVAVRVPLPVARPHGRGRRRDGRGRPAFVEP